jgi:hypothetical protein
MQLPAQAARQLPEQSTTLRVDSSSADDLRLQGALPATDIVDGPDLRSTLICVWEVCWRDGRTHRAFFLLPCLPSRLYPQM